MQKYICHQCRSPLFSADSEDLEVEIQCYSCRRFNYPSRQDQGLGLRGKDFQAKSIDHQCFNCRRLLFRSIGNAVIDAQCPYCHQENNYDTVLMKSGKWVPKLSLLNNLKETLAN